MSPNAESKEIENIPGLEKVDPVKVEKVRFGVSQWTKFLQLIENLKIRPHFISYLQK